MKKLLIPFTISIAWLVITTTLLILPSNNLEESGRFLRWLQSLGLDLDLKELEPDKWIHVLLFLIMVSLWCWGWAELIISYEKKIALFIATTLVWLSYGIAMEFVQDALRNGRTYDVKDMIADGIGCVLGLSISLILFRKKLRQEA
ncbi:MAG: VanZ family protein [Chitinophagaceae bacterium]